MARRSEADDLAMLLAPNYRTMAIVIGEGLLPFGILRKQGLYHESHSWGRVISTNGLRSTLSTTFDVARFWSHVLAFIYNYPLHLPDRCPWVWVKE